MPTGPRAGLRFRSSFMPWTKLALQLFDDPRYRRFWAAGPAQTSKTLLFFLIPTLYHLFEVGEPVIVGVPRIEDAQAIWYERLLPAIRVQPKWRGLLPSVGRGARGGVFKSLRFGNGSVLRFMSGARSDEERSSHTARVAILTEVDKFDTAAETSKEADPITQIEARTRAFGNRARIYAECTFSSREGRVFREVCSLGTDSQIWIACQHCGLCHCSLG